MPRLHFTPCCLVAAVLLIPACGPAFGQDSENSSPGNNLVAVPRVDFGIVVNDIEKSKAFYEKALGFQEMKTFTVDGEFAKKIGLTDGRPLNVHVMQLGEGDAATAVKLMEVSGVRPKRPDNTYLHSTFGVRYLTLYVSDMKAALKRAADAGAKPIAQGQQTIPAEVVEGMDIAVLRDPDGNMVELVGPTP